MSELWSFYLLFKAQNFAGLLMARVMKLVLNFRKRLLHLLSKGHLQLSSKSWVMNIFWQNFEKLPKTAVFAYFLTVFRLWTKSSYSTNVRLLFLIFQIVCNVPMLQRGTIFINYRISHSVLLKYRYKITFIFQSILCTILCHISHWEQ
jgi:hypothetical protein